MSKLTLLSLVDGRRPTILFVFIRCTFTTTLFPIVCSISGNGATVLPLMKRMVKKNMVVKCVLFLFKALLLFRSTFPIVFSANPRAATSTHTILCEFYGIHSI